MGLPTEHLARGTDLSLEQLQVPSAFIPWGPYLVFLENAVRGLSHEQLIQLCTSYEMSPFLRPLLSAVGVCFDPARYFQWIAGPRAGALQQLFRCLETQYRRVGPKEVEVESRVKPGYADAPRSFWECHAIGFTGVTTFFGLAPSVVTWEPVERGAVFRVRLPNRRPVRQLLAKISSWFRRDTSEDLRVALNFGHERSLLLEQEIYARKQAEEALRASERRLIGITDAMPGIVYQYYLSPDGRQGFRFVSGGATALTGFTPEELISTPDLIWRQILPEFVPQVLASVAASARDCTPWHEEFRIATKGGEVRWLRGHSVPEPADQSGTVIWNGVLTEITAERAHADALAASERRFRRLIEKSNEVVGLYDPKGIILFESPAAQKVKGFTPEEMIGRSSLELVHPDDLQRAIDTLGRIMERPGASERLELRSLGKDGSYRWLDFVATNELDDPAIRAIVGNYRDITAWREANDQLRASAKLLRNLSQQVPGVIYQFRQWPDGRSCFPYASEGIRDIYEVTPDEVRESAAAVFTRIHPDDMDAVVASISRSIETMEEWRCEYRVRLPNRGERWVEGHSAPERLNDGSMLWHGYISDITDRKSAELERRVSEERLRAYIDHAPIGVFVTDQAGLYVDANPAACRIAGYTREELLGLRITDLIPTEAVPAAVAAFEQVIASGKVEVELPLRPKSGEPRWMSISAVILSKDRVMGFVTDTTDRKRAEMREAEHVVRLQELAELSLTLSGEPGAVFERVVRMIGKLFGVRVVCMSEIAGSELQFRSVYVNGQVFANAGACPIAVTPCASVEASKEVMVFDRVAEQFSRAEFLRQHAAVSYCGLPVLDSNGKVVAVTCLLDDKPREYSEEDRHILRIIGQRLAVEMERGRAEAALRESEYRQRLALDAGQMGTWDWDIVHGHQVWDARQRELLGLPVQAVDGDTAQFFRRVHPADEAAVYQAVERSLTTGEDYEAEFRIIPSPGEVRWLYARGRLLRAPDGSPARMVGINADVTPRKMAVLALEEAERHQRLALDAGGMGTWDWEIGTEHLVWDAREVELMGLPPGTFDGQLTSFLSRIHPDDLAAVQQVLADAAVGKDFDGEFRIVLPNGDVRWIHGTGAVRPGDGERPARLIGINYDVTDRVLAQERLRDSVREKEAMLKEIHHRVKNNLQVISSLLNLQAEQITDAAGRAVFLESQSRVRAMALVHETLYGSESLAGIELPRYIDRLCDSLLQTYGGAGSVTLERTVASIDLDLDRALPVGLIISELVSNALKYAFPEGRNGRIEVMVAETENSVYLLRVSDDGVGLPSDLDLERTTSLGLYLVRVLAHQLRATLEVGRTGGTTFNLRFTA